MRRRHDVVNLAVRQRVWWYYGTLALVQPSHQLKLIRISYKKFSLVKFFNLDNTKQTLLPIFRKHFQVGQPVIYFHFLSQLKHLYFYFCSNDPDLSHNWVTGSHRTDSGRNSILDTTVFEYSTLWLVLSVLYSALFGSNGYFRRF